MKTLGIYVFSCFYVFSCILYVFEEYRGKLTRCSLTFSATVVFETWIFGVLAKKVQQRSMGSKPQK
jgi:hypothetical protein